MSENLVSVDSANFLSILTNLLDVRNDVRKEAEKIFEGILPNEKAILLLTVLLDKTVSAEVAELAAVLFRRLIITEYNTFKQLPDDTQIQIKSHLLLQIREDINQNLRIKISDIVAEIARNSVDEDGNNQWKEFINVLFEYGVSQNRALREVSLLMFSAVPGVIGNEQNKYLGVIHLMITQNLADPQCKEVCYAAAKALTSFLVTNEDEMDLLKTFNNCIELLLQFLSQELDTNNERAADLLTYLAELVGVIPQTFRGYLDFLFSLCFKGLSNSGYSESCRNLSVEVIVTICEAAPAMIRKLCGTHIKSTVDHLLKMMSEVEDDSSWEVSDNDDDEDEDESNVIGEASLDRVACALGGKTVLPAIADSLSKMMSSVNWKERHACLMAISAIGEGCHKQMLPTLSNLIDRILPFLNDEHNRVRYAACNALGQLATDFAPSFQKKFHGKVIFPLLRILSEANCPRVQAHAGAALVNFFEDSPKNILNPYIGSIVDSIEFVFKSKMNELLQKGTKLVLEQVVVTLASLADSINTNFQVYYDKFMPYLKYIVQNANTSELRLLRGKTIECVSLIGLAVGKEKFLSDGIEFMNLLLESQSAKADIPEDDPQLSYMIAAWARICKLLGKDFEPYLPFVMPSVLRAAALQPEVSIVNSDEVKNNENNGWEYVNLGEQNNISFGIRTSGLEDKATACEILVCYAEELKECFYNYAEETVNLMLPLLKFYFHDGVRISASLILPSLLESAKSRGETFSQEMWKYISPSFLQALDSEPEEEVLCEHMAAFAHCIRVLNCKCMSHDELLALMSFFSKKFSVHFEKEHARNQARNLDDYDEIVEDTFHKEKIDDSYLISRVYDIISSLFAVYQQEFFPYFDIILPHVISLVQPGRLWQDRQWALCIFSDITQYGGPVFACKYQEHFIEPLLRSVNDENADLRQTASWTLGCIGQYGGPSFAKVCSDSIPLLTQAIASPSSRSEENERATENAISAVTKFLMYNNSSIAMEIIIPVWFSWLPVWEDVEEVPIIFNFLCSLLEMKYPALLGVDNCNLPRVVQVFAEALHKEAFEHNSDVGRRFINILKAIQADADMFSKCIDTLNSDQQKALHLAFSAL